MQYSWLFCYNIYEGSADGMQDTLRTFKRTTISRDSY